LCIVHYKWHGNVYNFYGYSLSEVCCLVSYHDASTASVACSGGTLQESSWMLRYPCILLDTPTLVGVSSFKDVSLLQVAECRVGIYSSSTIKKCCIRCRVHELTKQICATGWHHIRAACCKPHCYLPPQRWGPQQLCRIQKYRQNSHMGLNVSADYIQNGQTILTHGLWIRASVENTCRRNLGWTGWLPAQRRSGSSSSHAPCHSEHSCTHASNSSERSKDCFRDFTPLQSADYLSPGATCWPFSSSSPFQDNAWSSVHVTNFPARHSTKHDGLVLSLQQDRSCMSRIEHEQDTLVCWYRGSCYSVVARHFFHVLKLWVQCQALAGGLHQGLFSAAKLVSGDAAVGMLRCHLPERLLRHKPAGQR